MAPGSYPTPTPPQGTYPQPTAPMNTTVATQKAKGSDNKLIFIIVGIIAAVGLVIGILVLIIGGLSGPKIDSNDPALGVWNAEEATMSGLAIAINDVFPGGVTMELTDNGKFDMDISGTSGSGSWEYTDSGYFNYSGSGIEGIGYIENNMLILENVLDSGVDLVFHKEGVDYAPSPEPTPAPSPEPTPAPDSDSNGGSSSSPGPAPGGEGSLNPPISLESDTYYYGYMDIYDYVGSDDISGVYDVWAHIREDDNGLYFEIYDEPDSSDPEAIIILSMYVDIVDGVIYPVIGYEDAWIFANYLTASDSDLTFSVYEDAIGLSSLEYYYSDEVDDFTVYFELRELGATWDEEYLVPPGY